VLRLFGNGTPDPHSGNLYKRLGADESAAVDEIESAYYALIREFPPERFPEEFRLIREAYETLSDAEAKARYDAEADPKVKRLFEQGVAAANEDDLDAAIKRFRKALVLRPEAAYIRLALSNALRSVGDLPSALEQLARVTAEHPSNHTYWVHRGFCEWALDHNADAERSFRRSLSLEAHDNERAHVGLARALADQGREAEAFDSLEAAIMADGVVDFEDFSYFFELVRLYARNSDVEAIERVTERIEAVLEEDWQVRRAAYQFAQFSQQLLEIQAFQLALALAEKSERMLPDDAFVEGLTQHIRSQKGIIDDWGRFQNDDYFRQPFKFFIAVLFQHHFDMFDDEAAREETKRRAIAVLNQQASVVVPTGSGHRSMADELDQLQYRYFRLSQLVNDTAEERMRVLSVGATQALLTCPHCSTPALAPRQTATLGCPDCGGRMVYNASSGSVSGKAAEDYTRLFIFIGVVVLWMFFSWCAG
jgi:tetratricopeptide (TPR) repeat protein